MERNIQDSPRVTRMINQFRDLVRQKCVSLSYSHSKRWR